MAKVLRLSPCALVIFKFLQDNNRKMKKNDIIANTGYSGRSFHYAISQLKKFDLIRITPDIEDTRRSYYSTN